MEQYSPDYNSSYQSVINYHTIKGYSAPLKQHKENPASIIFMRVRPGLRLSYQLLSSIESTASYEQVADDRG